MQQKNFFAFCLGFLFSTLSSASPLLDQQYSFRNFAVGVTSNPSEPIHSSQVENEIISQLQKLNRFEYREKASAQFKKSLQAGPVLSALPDLKKEGVDAAIVAELTRKEDYFDLSVSLFAVEPSEMLSQSVKKISVPFSLDNFSRITAQAFAEVTKSIPFDGSILKRDGYLVILDGGVGTFSPGMRLPTFTVEKNDGKLAFDETGVILIQKAEENISFGKILVEKKPLEVVGGNKIKLNQKLVSNDLPELMKEVSDANREPASEIVSDFEVSKGEVGRLALNVGTDLVEFRNFSTTGSEFYSNVFFPGAQLEGELWFTNRWFMDATLGMSMGKFANTANVPSDSQGSSLSNFRLQFGYRMNILSPERGPVVYAKLGYGKHSYSLGTTQPILFTSVAYGGMLLTGGVKFPFEEKWNFGTEINTLIFPMMAETPLSSGAKKANVTAWDFALRGSYSWNSDFDIEGRLIFRNASAEFSGDADRPDPISRATQSSKILQLGVSYYF
jgi:hypothetical protein